jgi:hypothetical protein
VTLLCVSSLRSWQKTKLTRPTFSRKALRLIQHISLWHSWTACLRTESFLTPFGLQELGIFFRPIFSLRGAMKNSVYSNCPHTVEDGHHRIHSECGPCYTELSAHSWRWPSQNTFWMWTAPYWTRSSRTRFGVSIIVWRLAGYTLNITCNFLYCNHQVHRDFFDHPVYRVSCGLRSAVTSNDILYAGLRTVIRSQYISQQMHLNKHSSWQVPNCYMFRNGVAILRVSAGTTEHDFVIL